MKLHLRLVLVVLFISFLSGQKLTNLPDFEKYLDQKEKEYEAISSKFGTATWNLYSGEGEIDLVTSKKDYARLFSEPQLLENLNYWNSKSSEIQSQILKRRIELWKKMITGSSIDLSPEIAEFSAKLLEDINKRNPSDEKQTAELSQKVIELMKLRNNKAKEAGYNNYADFALDFSGAGAKKYDEFVNEFDKRTAPAYKELVDKIKTEKGSVSLRDLFPYFMRTPDPKYSEDSLYILMKETVGNIGFDYSKLPIRFVVRNADFGGNCIGIDIPNDFRVIMVPNMPISVYLHELGHGLQWMKTSINNPILEGYEWIPGHGGTMFYEGMAEVLANFCRNKNWYKKYSNFTDEQIVKNLKTDKYAAAFTFRFTIFNFLAEVEIYRNIDKDPQEIYSSLYKRFLMLDGEPMRKFSFVNTMLIDYPCYLHNYLMADVIAKQVHKTLEKLYGENYIFKKESGEFLVEKLYKDGVLKDWRQILLEATGNEFDYDGFLSHYGL